MMKHSHCQRELERMATGHKEKDCPQLRSHGTFKQKEYTKEQLAGVAQPPATYSWGCKTASNKHMSQVYKQKAVQPSKNFTVEHNRHDHAPPPCPLAELEHTPLRCARTRRRPQSTTRTTNICTATQACVSQPCMLLGAGRRKAHCQAAMVPPCNQQRGIAHDST